MLPLPDRLRMVRDGRTFTARSVEGGPNDPLRRRPHVIWSDGYSIVSTPAFVGPNGREHQCPTCGLPVELAGRDCPSCSRAWRNQEARGW